MTHGSLFSGIGGFDLAAEWMGWQNVFHCEILENKRKWLKHRFPNSVSYADIRTQCFKQWKGQVDFITGGIPARLVVKSENGKAWKGTYTYGLNFSGVYKKLNLLEWLMKMWTEQFQTEYLTERSLTWKASVTPAGRPLLSLQVSVVHHIEGIEFGLLPTCLKDDWKGGTSQVRKDNGKLRLDQLRHWWKIKTGLSAPNPNFYRIMMGYPDGWMKFKDTGMP